MIICNSTAVGIIFSGIKETAFTYIFRKFSAFIPYNLGIFRHSIGAFFKHNIKADTIFVTVKCRIIAQFVTHISHIILTPAVGIRRIIID